VITKTYDGKWKGEVEFYSPLTIQQEAEWEYAIGAYRKSVERDGGLSAQNLAFLPGIIACVKSWHLDKLPERITLENFPARPKLERAKLIAWLVTNISEIYQSDDDPNE
jgi:hypothetical protein